MERPTVLRVCTITMVVALVPGCSTRRVAVDPPVDRTAVLTAVQLTHLGGINANPSWSPDGRLLAFDSNVGLVPGQQSIRVLDIASGRDRQLTQGGRDQAPRWSPDGQRLVLGSFRDGNAEVYSIDALGRNMVRLTSDPLYDSGVVLSPDGRSVLWFAGNVPQTDDDDYGDSDIWRMKVDGTERRRLTSAPGSDTYPRWSPDGQRIVFTSHRDGNAELYVMHADGTGVRRLTDHPAADDHAAWSRDGSLIVFTSWRTGLEQLFVVVADVSGAAPVHLDVGLGQARNPDWSPVDDRIAFFGQAASGVELFVVTFHGIKPTVAPRRRFDAGVGAVNVTNSGFDDSQPAFSPDGRFLAFVSDRSLDVDWAERGVFFLELASGAVGRMRRSRGDARPDWSPEGSRIAMVNTDRHDKARIVIQRTDGRFTLVPKILEDVSGGVRWSPDGHWLAFATASAGGDATLSVARIDGAELRHLTTGAGRNHNPAWSHDGSRLAFTSTRDGNSEIYLVRADGSGLTRLTSDPGSDDFAAWSPDGRRIAFVSTREGNADVFVMAADGGRQTNVTRHNAHDAWPAWSPDSLLLAFASRRTGNSEIYIVAAPR